MEDTSRRGEPRAHVQWMIALPEQILRQMAIYIELIYAAMSNEL